jgi:hypothetical protein
MALLAGIFAFRPAFGSEWEALLETFRNPPALARPAVYWCWLNGYVDANTLQTELQELASKGIAGVYVFDIGTRGAEKPLPAGPAFLSEPWLATFRQAVQTASELGIEVALITSSSWNAGGPWIPPELASMGLFQSVVIWEGPGHRSEMLPLPPLPAQAPRDAEGKPLFYRDVAVLAIPEKKLRASEEFVFQLQGTEVQLVDRAVFYQASASTVPQGKIPRTVREFALWISETSDEPEAFRLLIRGAISPEPQPQEVRFPPTPARYVRLELLSSLTPDIPGFDLAEFELYTPEGLNVASSLKPDGTRIGATLVWWGSQAAADGPGSAACIHDGIRDNPRGTWRSAELPPLVIDNPEEIVDLTGRIRPDGTLSWDVPPGRWRIVRYGCGNTGQRLVLPSPNSAGLVLDHLNPQATEFHFRYILERLKEHLGDLRQTALRQLYVCSYEVRGATWTPRFAEEFRQRRGYELKRFLPALDGHILKDWPYTRRFLLDFRKTLGELVVDGFYRRAAEICRENGLQLCGEAGGPGLPLHQVPVDALQAQGAIDIPRGEFWIQHDIWVVKETACAAHIYGKPQVDMEAFTSWRHWQDSPWVMKPIADRAFVEGANHFTFHTMAHRPASVHPPGWVYHAGSHFSPHIAWWPLADAFVDYISRCCATVQHGQFVADVCYYYGDGGFNYVPPKHIDPRLGPGYDYDVCNAEVLLNRAEIREGKLFFREGHSTGYHLLVLPERREISPRVLARLAELVEQGLTLAGPPPLRSNSLSGYPACDAEVRRLAEKLWGPALDAPSGCRQFGKGRVMWGISLREILDKAGVGPDFWVETSPAEGGGSPTDGNLPSAAGPSWPLDFIHRKSDKVDIYFVWNKTDTWQNRWVRLRSGGRPPQCWDPLSGQTRPLRVYRLGENVISVYLQLPPRGSLFVLFPGQPAENSEKSVLRAGTSGASTPATLPSEPSAPSRPTRLQDVQQDGRSLLAEPVTVPAVELGAIPGWGSSDIIFRRPGRYQLFFGDNMARQVDVPSIPTIFLRGPWKVRFTPGWNAPEEIEFPELIPWNEHPDPGIRHYSGVATYEIQWDLQDELLGGARAILALGEVHFLAQVRVNGQLAGTIWAAPWEVDITKLIRPGRNTLQILVANDWNNRLVGDAELPPEKRLTETNIPYSISWRRRWKETPLQPAGLLGPVRLFFAPCLSEP